MAIITTGSHPKALWPGVRKFYGEEYKRHDPIWPKMFQVLTSEQAYEEEVETIGFGLMTVKAQGAGITYDTASQGTVSRYTAVTYSNGYIVTMEELMDNLYEKVSYRRAGKLARSGYETEETVHANVFNRAFNTDYTGGDGKALIVSDHPCASGSQSNVLTTAADISEAAIEDLTIQIMDSVDSRGLRFNNKPQCLLVSNSDTYEAHRIVKSVLQNDSANNATNAIRDRGVFPDGIITNPYFTDSDAWFIMTDCADGLTHFTRMPMTFDKDNDFDTKNLKASSIARWSQGWSNWRALYGSGGA